MIKKYITHLWFKEYRIIKFSLFASLFIVLTKNVIFPYIDYKWKGFMILFIELPLYLFIGEKILFKDSTNSRPIGYNCLYISLIALLDGLFSYSPNHTIVKQLSFWFLIVLFFITLTLPIYHKIRTHFFITK